MAKKQLERFTSPVGVARYPHLVKPDTKFDSDGVYHTNLIIPAEEATEFVAQLEAARDNFAAERIEEDPKLKKYAIADVYEEELNDDGDETGNLIFKFKLKARVSPKVGEPFSQTVRIFDAQGTLLETTDLSIWGGSQFAVAGDIFPYAMASSKQIGVSLRCKAVQVIELVTGGGATADAFGFEATDGYTGQEQKVLAGGTEGEDSGDDNEF